MGKNPCTSEVRHETQASISEWCEATFGPVSSNFRVAIRANEEMAELLKAVAKDDHEKAAEEAADVAIILCRLATKLGCDLCLDAGSGREEARPTLYATLGNSHMSHLLSLLEWDPRHTDAKIEVQRVVGNLASLCVRLGMTLADEVNKKMAVNRAREWKLDGTGHGYHVKKV